MYLGDTPRPLPKGLCPSGLPFFIALLAAAVSTLADRRLRVPHHFEAGIELIVEGQ